MVSASADDEHSGEGLGSQPRLITYGGDFDSAGRSYEDNVIAFATLIDTRPA